MALTVNYVTKVITVPQADLTLVSGNLYSLDTDQFRINLNAVLSSQTHIWMPDAYTHNGEVTVAGTTFARTIELINGYSVTFEDTGSAYSVRLEGSNNNIFDVENGILNPTDKVTVISTNSAGLIQTAAVSSQDLLDISDAVWDEATSGHQTAGSFGKALTDASTATVDAFYAKVVESGLTFEQFVRLTASVLFGKSTVTGSSATFRDINDTKDRIVSAVDSIGSRSSVSLDGD